MNKMEQKHSLGDWTMNTLIASDYFGYNEHRFPI